MRYLRGYNGPPVTVSLTLSALEPNEPNLTPSSNLLLGLAARFAPDGGRKRIVRLSALPWVREMAGWDANHWSWLLAILISQASDVLPNPEDSAGLILSLSYKVAPTRWAALHAEMPDAFDSVVTGDSRFTQSMLRESPSKMRAALEKELRTNAEREAEYWRLFPDAPNWALGTGFSTEEETMAHLKRKKN